MIGNFQKFDVNIALQQTFASAFFSLFSFFSVFFGMLQIIHSRHHQSLLGVGNISRCSWKHL